MNSQYKKALRLEYFTVVYNIIEAIASITFGSIANSIALVGFGLDSIVESLSGFVLIWRLQKHNKLTPEEEERIEKRATIFVGITFLVLAAYVLFESIKKIVTKEIPDPSLAGIIIALMSIVIMPILGLKKRKMGIQLNLKSLIADSKETFVCSTLSVALLLGLAGRYFFNFWYADPIVGLIIVVYLVREGKELLMEDEED
ncbi:MAG: cation transporter [Methanocellales archaeon]|nr:cation transporter [Methanocellales archaeon]MDD3421189.1 cation transporter [Methanocellales archaeon]MDD4897954.1 cation transporter [Methanocellales archaeon]MDD5447096.1 cation transporter [Methanocellales archaeon]